MKEEDLETNAGISSVIGLCAESTQHTSSKTRDPAWGGASSAQMIEQSSGKLTPTSTTARKEDAAV